MILDKAKEIFIGREKIIETYIEGESVKLFENADLLENKYCKTFAIQIISNAIGDAYDFFCYIHGTNNLFYKNIKQLDENMAKKIFKWLSIYHTVCYKEKNEIKRSDVKDSMIFVFNWGALDKKNFNYFKKIKRRNNSQFEWQFATIMLRDLFHGQTLNPVILAHVGNLIYNSRNVIHKEMKHIKVNYTIPNCV